MSGDPYIKENERLEAEIARLQIEHSHRVSQCHDLDEMLRDKEAEIARLQAEEANDAQTIKGHADTIRRLRAALEEIAGWTLPTGRDAQDVARKALAKEGK